MVSRRRSPTVAAHSTTLIHNWTLRRRDASLHRTHKSLSNPLRRELRCAPLEGRNLFNPDACTEAHTSFVQTSQAQALAKSLARPKAPANQPATRRLFTDNRQSTAARKPALATQDNRQRPDKRGNRPASTSTFSAKKNKGAKR